jgi:hypothetical protein
MADSIVGGLFGITPEAYQQQQNQQALGQAAKLAQMSPFELAKTGIGYGANRLAGAIGGALGGQDPQLQLISMRNAIMKGVDLNDPEALKEASSRLAQLGDMQGAYGAAELAQKRAESSAAINLREAQAIKASMLPKLTGDERYIAQLNFVENKLRKNEKPSDEELSMANIASQMLAKPRSFFDQASGQTVVVPATDPSKAFPLVFKQFSGSQEQPTAKIEVGTTAPPPSLTKPSMPTPGVATVQKVTEGNLPASSQKEIGEIDANLTKLSQSGPELNQFLELLKEKKVKYDLTSNAYDIIGSIVPPAFGQQEFGDQVQKDTIERALNERVNTLLLMANGTQTEGDATRAKSQIASPSTYLSQNRMKGAIEGLINAEEKLKKELEAKKTSLQSKGQATTPTTPAPSKGKTGELSREEKINIFIRANNGKPTRQQAIDALSAKGLL